MVCGPEDAARFACEQEPRRLVKCGLTPAEALAAGPSVPAGRFRLSGRARRLDRAVSAA